MGFRFRVSTDYARKRLRLIEVSGLPAEAITVLEIRGIGGFRLSWSKIEKGKGQKEIKHKKENGKNTCTETETHLRHRSDLTIIERRKFASSRAS